MPIEVLAAVGRYDDFFEVVGVTKPGGPAYVDGEVAGWCSVAPRSTYRRLMHSRTIPFADDQDAWSVVCFVVRPRFRRQGLMHALLAGAVAHAAAGGAAVVEGYPIWNGGDERVDVISGYVGTSRLFEGAGFVLASPTTAHSGGRDRVVMRYALSESPGLAGIEPADGALTRT